MQLIEILVKKFDFRKNPSLCNMNGCNNLKNKSITLKEIDLRKQNSKDIAKINFCQDHINELKVLMKDLNNESGKDFKVIRAIEEK